MFILFGIRYMLKLYNFKISETQYTCTQQIIPIWTMRVPVNIQFYECKIEKKNAINEHEMK